MTELYIYILLLGFIWLGVILGQWLIVFLFYRKTAQKFMNDIFVLTWLTFLPEMALLFIIVFQTKKSDLYSADQYLFWLMMILMFINTVIYYLGVRKIDRWERKSALPYLLFSLQIIGAFGMGIVIFLTGKMWF